MQFLASLDAWYRSDRSDCVATLTSASLHSILRLVEEPAKEVSIDDLRAIAGESTDSKTQLTCYEEIWRRTLEKGFDAGAELLPSIPPMYRQKFRERLLNDWVEKKGIACLPEITASHFTTTADFLDAFVRCARARPEDCVSYVRASDFLKLQERFGATVTRNALLFEACQYLPGKLAVETLSKEPPSIWRDGRIADAVGRAVKEDPGIAAEMAAQYPHNISEVCYAATVVARRDPRVAASIVNSVPGERLRTATARKIALRLPGDQSSQFVESIEDSLTKETVRTALNQLKKPTPAPPAK